MITLLGNPFDTTKRFLSLQPMFPPKPLDNVSPEEGACSEGLDAFRLFHEEYNVGEKTPVILYTYITLIAMQGHHTESKNIKRNNVVQYIKHGVIIYCYIIGWKDNQADDTVVHS